MDSRTEPPSTSSRKFHLLMLEISDCDRDPNPHFSTEDALTATLPIVPSPQQCCVYVPSSVGHTSLPLAWGNLGETGDKARWRKSRYAGGALWLT